MESIRTEVVESVHLAQEVGLASREEFEKIYGRWTIKWEPQSDATLEGLATRKRHAEKTYWRAKSELDPDGPVTADPGFND